MKSTVPTDAQGNARSGKVVHSIEQTASGTDQPRLLHGDSDWNRQRRGDR